MRFSPLLLVGVLMGCAPETTPRPDASFTSNVCGIAAPHPIEVSDFARGVSLSEDCIDQLLHDYGADVPSLEDGSDILWTDLVDWEIPETAQDVEELDELFRVWNTPLGTLVTASYGMLSLEWDGQGAVLYEEAAASFAGVRFGEDLETHHPAAFSPSSGVLKIGNGASWTSVPETVSILIHEKSHAEGTRHVRCSRDAEGKRCDADWEGAYGAQIEFLELGSVSTQEEEVKALLAETVKSLEENIR